jgi:Protein of unknown function DUF262
LASIRKRKTLDKSRFNMGNEEEPVDDLDPADEVIPFTYTITSYGADYPVDSLIKRMENNDIIVPTFGQQLTKDSDIVGFQRDYVWPRPKADRFIESLLLGLPVPGIFLVKEPSGVLLVLDGHQRLYTLRAFYDGVIHKEEYRLTNVQERFEGKRYKDLDTEDRRRLDDSIIHATIVRQDEPKEDQSSIYVIFERLNAGGVNLQPQEVRVALYHGEFVRVLRELNDLDKWRALYGSKSRRLKDMELILRFFALFYYAGEYQSPMKDFLNRYMATNRRLERQSEADLKAIFGQTTTILCEAIGQRAFRPRTAVNAAVVDSLMTGVATRLAAQGPIRNKQQFKDEYEKLINNKEYITAVESGTSQEANVSTRLRLAKQAFATVK